MDVFKIGDDLKYVGQLLETIRKFSKKHSLEYGEEQYNNDFTLLQHLLHEKINELLDENK